MAVTIHDVAKYAGVSHTTVSWVIHNDPRITRETKEKVHRAIKKLNYHPNVNARSLVRGKTNTIAIIVYFFSTVFELEVLKGIEKYFENTESTYNVSIFSTRGNPELKEKLLHEILYGKRADAVIMLSMNPGIKILSEYRKYKVPLVLIEESLKGAMTVKNNNFAGAFEATEYLINKGRKNIGIVVGEFDSVDSGLSPLERFNGYREALKKYRIKFRAELVFKIENYYLEEGREVIKLILKNNMATDALFCAAGDMVAAGIIDQAKKSGLEVPGDIAVIGYDDIPTASLISPPLTTVRQPIERLGKTAIDMAINTLEGKKPPENEVIFEQELVIRESA